MIVNLIDLNKKSMKKFDLSRELKAHFDSIYYMGINSLTSHYF